MPPSSQPTTTTSWQTLTRSRLQVQPANTENRSCFLCLIRVKLIRWSLWSMLRKSNRLKSRGGRSWRVGQWNVWRSKSLKLGLRPNSFLKLKRNTYFKRTTKRLSNCRGRSGEPWFINEARESWRFYTMPLPRFKPCSRWFLPNAGIKPFFWSENNKRLSWCRDIWGECLQATFSGAKTFNSLTNSARRLNRNFFLTRWTLASS